MCSGRNQEIRYPARQALALQAGEASEMCVQEIRRISRTTQTLEGLPRGEFINS